MNQIAITIPNAEALPPSMLSNIREGFQSAFEQAEAWREKALAVKVTSLADKEAMKQAREMRLALKNIRVEAEKKRKALKEDALVMGRAIDGVNNLLLAAIQPLERHLEEQEKFAERLAEQERQRDTWRRFLARWSEAAKKAAAAPDKTKLRTIADSVRAIPFPAVTTPEANVILADIAAKRESFAKWIEAQTEKL